MRRSIYSRRMRWSFAVLLLVSVLLSVFSLSTPQAKAYIPDGGGSIPVSIKGVNSGLCWDVPGFSRDDGVQIWQWPCNGYSNQEWYPRQVARTDDVKVYEFHSANSGKCLDLSGNGQWNGNRIQQWGCNNTIAQAWALKPDNGGSYKFVAYYGYYTHQYCIDIPGNSTNQRVYLQLWDCNGTTAQSFYLF